MTGNKVGRRVEVKELNEKVQLDRTEIKNVLEYLSDLGFINLETIGGPFLYGHLTVNESGLRECGNEGD